MYSEQVFYLILDPAPVLGVGQHGHHGGVPVVAVDNVHAEVQVGYHVKNGPAEEGILLAFGIAAPVNGVAKVLLVVYEINGDVVQNQLLQAYIGIAPAHSGIEVEHVLHLIPILLLDAMVVGSDDSGVYSQLFQSLGQSAHHVGQTAGLGQGRTLGSRQQHIWHLGPAPLPEHIFKLFFH